MMPDIYAAIEAAVANGIPPQYIAEALVQKGFPSELVNQALNAWLLSHGRKEQKTGFKDWLKKYSKKAMPAVIITVLISTITSATMLLRPWPTKIMVDSAFGDVQAPGPLAPYTHTATLILITSLLTIAIFLLGAVIGTLRDFVVLKFGYTLNRDIKYESLRHILHLPLYHQERLAKGDYIYRQNNLTDSLSDLVLDTTSTIAQSVIMILGILAIMFSFDVKLTLISIVVIPFLFLLIKLFGPILGAISQKLTENNSTISTSITESVDNAETVQSYNLEDKQLNKALSLWLEKYNLTKRGMFFSRLYRSANSLLIILGTSAVMYFGGSAALHHSITLGQLLIFMTYMGYLLDPVETLAAEIAMRNQKLIDVGRVYEILSDHENVESLRQDNHFPITQGAIEFQNVSYKYKDMTVLDSVSLTIPPGKKVGIIGPSGSGKSTMLKLLPLFIEPVQGRILIDGIDIQTVSIKELRQNISWISQAPQLFSGTLLDNLQDADTLRRLTAGEIQMAIDVANVTEFVNKIPGGLAGQVGEGGNSLSGGQKQRVAIARGLLKNARIVCMDEPTAALDSKSENFIRDSIDRLIAGRTVLMVTHRKALLSKMDIIYVLEAGKLTDVNKLGGLEVYLNKIEGMEKELSPEEAEKSLSLLELAAGMAEKRASETKREQAVNAENEQTAAEIIGPTVTNDGSIKIDHQI